MPIKKSQITAVVFLAVCLFAVYSYRLFLQAAQQPHLPILGQVLDFQLQDENNQPFTMRELNGKIWIANFFFTSCGGICPIMSKNMAALHRSFDMIGDVNQVSITVDPEFDSPEILKDYARHYKANISKWHFLTGPSEQIKDLAVKSFKLGSIDEPVFHSSKFALVDRQGRIRGYYDGVQSGEVSQLFKDTSTLLKESESK